MQTYIVYIGLLLLLFLFARRAEKTQKKQYVIFAIIALSLVAGLRKSTVGLDTEEYINAFANIRNGRLDLAYGMEWSFRYICYVLSFVFRTPQMLLLFFSFLTNALIVLRFWDFREKISFSCATSIYYIMFYMMSLNLTRQFIAISIVFYATRYISKSQNLRFIVSVLIASLFHKSSLLSIIYMFFDVMAWKYLSKNKRIFLIIIGCVFPLLFVVWNNNFIEYAKYFTTLTLNVGLMIAAKLVLLIVSSFTMDRTELYGLSYEEKINTRYMQRTTTTAYIVGLLLTILGYAWKIVSRAGLYFYVCEPIYIGYLFKQKNTKTNFVLKLIVIAIFAYQLVGNFIGNGQGQHPYLFFWQ